MLLPNNKSVDAPLAAVVSKLDIGILKLKDQILAVKIFFNEKNIPTFPLESFGRSECNNVLQLTACPVWAVAVWLIKTLTVLPNISKIKMV